MPLPFSACFVQFISLRFSTSSPSKDGRTVTPAREPTAGTACPTARIAVVLLKLPPFWPTDPAVWFLQVEAQFTLKGIVQQCTKFDHVIAVLVPEVATEVRDIILNPPEDTPYDLLKAALIKWTEASEQRKLQQLLTAEELGDRKPSHLLRRMQQLLGDAGPPSEGAFVRQLFLQRMPPSVMMVLASASTTLTLPQLAEMADRILEVANPLTVAPVTTSQSTTDLQQLWDQLSRLISTLDATVKRTTEPQDRSSRSSSRATSRRQSRASNPAGICWYHRKFGDRAKRCRQPCTYQGNGPASR